LGILLLQRRKGEWRGIQVGNVFWKQDSPALENILCLEIDKSCMNPESTFPISLAFLLTLLKQNDVYEANSDILHIK